MSRYKGSQLVDLPSGVLVLFAFSECPACGVELFLQPQHGYVAFCPGCLERLVVFVAPIAAVGHDAPLCTLQVRTKDGRWNHLHTPSLDEFGEW